MKILQQQAELFRANGRTDRRTDMTYLIVSFHNLANFPKNHEISHMQLLCCNQGTYLQAIHKYLNKKVFFGRRQQIASQILIICLYSRLFQHVATITYSHFSEH